MLKEYALIRIESNLRKRLKQSSPKMLTYSQYIENLLDFKQNFDMKEKNTEREDSTPRFHQKTGELNFDR